MELCYGVRLLKGGYYNYVSCIPFEHLCAAARKDVKGKNNIREEAQKKFIEKWNDFLPVDVSTWREKFSYIFRDRQE